MITSTKLDIFVWEMVHTYKRRLMQLWVQKNVGKNLPWQKRAAIFLKAADLIAGPYRAKINAATMLAQSKNAFQAEIDASCEFIDFLRFNAHYMQQIYAEQPESADGIWNRFTTSSFGRFCFCNHSI